MRLFLTLTVVLAGLSTASAQLRRGYEPTRINIVLVAFSDNAVLPHGFTTSPGGVLTPGGNSYTLDDFARKFGASGSFEGLVDVANDHETVTSYGSLREYYKEISEGSLDFEVRIVNQDLGGDHVGYPEWIILPKSRHYYQTASGEFFDDALEEMHEYIRMNYETETLDWSGLPATTDDPTDELVVFVYAGWQRDDGGDAHDLHPQAEFDHCCYVTGERQGDGNGPDNSTTPPTPDPSEKFTGIGIHAHELGHILGLGHPSTRRASADTNPYTGQTGGAGGVPFWRAGSISAWCTMQNGRDGPATEGGTRSNGDEGFYYAHGSCPSLFNPLYMRDLDEAYTWDVEFHEINEGMRSYRIDPAPDDYYEVSVANADANGIPSVILEFREADSFGQYNDWYHFDQAPGLLVWKRYGTASNGLQLIPADNRRIFNALRQNPFHGSTVREWDAGFSYPWIDRISDPFGAVVEVEPDAFDFGGVEANGLRTTIRSMEAYQATTPPALSAHIMLNGSNHRVTQDWVTDSSHFMNPLHELDHAGNSMGTTANDPVNIGLRNIVVHRTGTNSETGYAILNIYPNYYETSLASTPTAQSWSGDIYVGADIKIPSGVTLTIEQDASVYFLTPRPEEDTSRGGTGHSELIVQRGATLVVKTGATFRSANEAINSDDPITYEDESYGLYVMLGGKVTIEGLEVTDGTFYLYSPASGRHSKAAGGIQLLGDVIVSGGETELRLKRSTRRRDSVTVYLRNNSDLSGTTPSDGKVGLVARQGALLNASDDFLRPLNESPGLIEDSWAGIISEGPGSKVNLRRASLMHGKECVSSLQEGEVLLTAAYFLDCGMIEDALIEEGNTEVILSVASVFPSGPVEWTITGGRDRDKFSLSEGILTILQTPDFENPHDAGADNTFEVDLEAIIGPSKAKATATGSITVRVTDNPSEELPDPVLGEPGEPTLSKNDVATSDNLLSFTVTLTTDVTGSPIRTVFWRHTTTGLDPDNPDNSDPAETTPWKARTVEQDVPSYSSWFQSGREFTLDLIPDTVHEIEVKVGHCDPSGPNASTCDALSEVLPDESYFVWSQTATLTHASPAAPLVISGGQEIEYWEGYTTPINTFQTDAYSWETVTWSLDSTPHTSYFSLSEDGELSFTDQRPAFDPAGTNIYMATFRATTARRASDPHTFTVTLKEDSEGSVSITHFDPPRVGTEMTATVRDLDGSVEVTKWLWSRSMVKGGSIATPLLTMVPPDDASYNPDAMNRTLTPLAPQMGYRLFLNVTYNDAHGTDKKLLVVSSTTVADETGTVPSNQSGSIAFSQAQTPHETPRVGRDIEATLTDLDAPIRNWTMTWERVPLTGDATSVKEVRGVSDEQARSTYTPVPADAGSRLQVSVSYTDDYGIGQTAEETSNSIPPNELGVVTLTNQDPPTVNMKMTASLEDPDDPTNLVWTWNRVCPGDSSPYPRSDQTHTPTTADIGCKIRVILEYDDAFADGNQLVVVSSGTTIPEPSVNTAPTISEFSKRSVTERALRRDAGVYEATDAQNHALAWSLRGTDSEGTDHEALRLKDDPTDPNRKTLEFRTSPNFEEKSSYSVEIKVTETGTPGQLSGTFQRTVNVLNGPDPGYVTFSPDPPTACSSTTILLTDEDGGINSAVFR